MQNPNNNRNGYYDTRLLQREFYNKNAFTVEFHRMDEMNEYVLGAGKPAVGPRIIRVDPDSFGYLPHAFYVAKGVGIPDGAPIKGLWNFEKAMFKGNKIPSNLRGHNQ